MSQMERNKGRLIPTNIDTEGFSEDILERYKGSGFVVINKDIYQVVWDVKSDEEVGFADIKVSSKGIIDFHTCHYNGGGHWTEVIEDVLKRVPTETQHRTETEDTIIYTTEKGFL